MNSKVTSNTESPETAKQYVIVSVAYGAVQVVRATIENAMSYFNAHKDNIDAEVKRIVDRDRAATCLVDLTSVAAVLKDIALGQDCEAKLQNLFYGRAPRVGEDSRPQVEVLPSWGRDVAHWFIQTHPALPIKQLSAYYLPKTLDELIAQFPWLGPLKAKVVAQGRVPLVVQCSQSIDTAFDYRIIENSLWREGTAEYHIVNRILEFVRTNLTGRDWTILEVAQIGKEA